MADWKLPVNCRKCRDHLGHEFPTLLARLKKGWSVEKALTEPLDRRGRKLGGKNVHAIRGPQS